MAMGSEKLESRWTYVDGILMHMRISTNEVSGDAVPLVLLHGLGVSGTYWLPTATLLAEHFRVFVPDLPGFGDSEKPHRVFDLRELADVVVAWMDAIGLGRAALICNSMGCQVAVHAARAHPERIPRLVLQGPTIDPSARSAAQQIGRLLVDGFVEPLSLIPIVTRDYMKCGYRRIAATLRHSLDDPIEEMLRMVQTPSLVIRGARDPIVPKRWAEDAARLLPFGRLLVMPRAAHAINFSHPEELARIVRDFLLADHPTGDGSTGHEPAAGDGGAANAANRGPDPDA